MSGRRRRLAVRAALGLAAASALAIPLTAVLAQTAYDLPDLVGEAPTNAYLQSYVTDTQNLGQANRLLLRFDGYVRNDGTGPLDFQGDPVAGTMVQYVKPSAGGPLEAWTYAPGENRPAFQYDTSDGHFHWHLKAADEYSLWDENRVSAVKKGAKTGFCLYDIDRVGTQGPAAAVYDNALTGGFCNRNRPTDTALREGISAGWRDLYDAGLAFQWVDVSDVAPGRYWLASRPDPDDVVRESNETNNGVVYAASTVTVPGYVAEPVTVSTLAGRTITVPLASRTVSDAAFGTPGARRYRVRSLPSQGGLSVNGVALAAGDALPVGATTLRYSAPAQFTGTASFAFTAEDSTSRFPTDASNTPQGGAVQATATITVGAYQSVSVGIAGAPGTIAPGGVAQLRSVVTNAGSEVVWAVEGVEGGNDTVGRIGTDGRYVAPAAAPAGGVVHIRATSVEDPTAWTEVKITIGTALANDPAPAPGSGLAPGVLLGKPVVMLRGRSHVATVRVAVRGRVVITAEAGGKRLAGCSSTVLAGQSMSCVMAPRTTSGLVVYARLRTADGRNRTTRTTVADSSNGIGRLRARRSDAQIAVAVPADRTGAMTVELAVDSRVVSRCRDRLTVGQVMSCVRTLPAARRRPVTVTVTLVGGGVTGLRRLVLPVPRAA